MNNALESYLDADFIANRDALAKLDATIARQLRTYGAQSIHDAIGQAVRTFLDGRDADATGVDLVAYLTGYVGAVK